MNKVRSVMRCEMVATTQYGSELKFTPVCGTDEGYKEFFEATPSGVLELRVLKKALAQSFEPGRLYTVDIEKIKDC